MRLSRCGLSATLLLWAVGGCQALSPDISQSLDGGAQQSASASGAAYRDEDSFTGRLAAGTSQFRQTVSAPFDPAQREQAQREKALQKKQQQQLAARKRATQKRSGLSAWLFPEPKKPQTLSEWLAQDRPTADSK